MHPECLCGAPLLSTLANQLAGPHGGCGRYSRALTIEGGFSWSKYFAVSNSTPQNLKPTNISKLNTVLQCFLIVGAAARAAALVPPVLEPDSVEVLWNALVLTTGVTTVWSWAVRDVQGAGRGHAWGAAVGWAQRVVCQPC
eukprot:COSAG01_NODE_8664_length_2704_cov_3.383877_2_plen_141_part_00